MAEPRVVLVVDDDAAVRGVAARILRKRGYLVLEAADATSAMAALEAADIAVVLSDIAMPDTDGPAMASKMRAMRPALSFVFMSGNDANASRAAAIDDAVFVAKPFSAGSLTAAVAGFVGQLDSLSC